MVVGNHVCRHLAARSVRHRQRTPRAGRPASAVHPLVTRRDPQHVGAESRREEGSHSGLHAKMAMFIVAEPLAAYQAWVDNQRKPATTPTDSVAHRGMDIFVTHACV